MITTWQHQGGGAFVPAAHNDRVASCPSRPCTLGKQQHHCPPPCHHRHRHQRHRHQQQLQHQLHHHQQ